MKRTCTRCGRRLVESKFNTHVAGRDGLRAKCKECYRDQYLQNTYGITLKQYKQMMADQRWRCAICRKRRGARRLHVDHDHATGRVRGLLCYSCNIKLGWFEKQRTSVLDYLAKS